MNTYLKFVKTNHHIETNCSYRNKLLYKEQNNKTVATIRDAKAGYEKKLIVNYKNTLSLSSNT